MVRHYHGSSRKARGFGAIVLLAFVLVLGAASFGLALFTNRSSTASIDDPRTTEALAGARAALMGYALRRGGDPGDPQARAGELPCPDMDNDGWEEASCNTPNASTFAIGRVPWRTLGMPEPKDSAGETLWYAVANPFRRRVSNNNDLNSNTRGNLEVRGSDGAAVLTTEAVAVLIAPGQTLGAQNRSVTQNATCATTGTNILRNLCADNYLETANGIDNATNNSPFIAAPPSNTFNDRVLYLTFNDYLPAVEMRVGSELRNLLLAYRQFSDCQCFPWADSWAYSGGIADVGVNRGRFPSRPYPHDWGETTTRGTIPPLPQWISDNDWHNLVWYSVGKLDTDGGGVNCLFCSINGTLIVDGSPVSALLFTPGPPPAGIDRASSANRDNLTYYLDDAQNNDGGTCPGWNAEHANNTVGVLPMVAPASCDTYVTPTSTAANRDRLFTVTLPSCAASASALVDEVLSSPCHTVSVEVRPECQLHVTELATCACSAAAALMIVEPCRNTLNPPACRSALSQLQICGL